MDNSEYLTVTALTQYIKRKFDVDPYLGHVYLTGEISNFRFRPNGHQYFSLKDDKAKISCMMFKSVFSQVKFRPEEGMKVRVKGHVSVFAANGAYQLYIDSMEPDGLGALYLAYEQLKKKLKQMGVLDLPKKTIPAFPKRIAVVTSQSGAVIHDIMTTVQRRYPIVQLVLFPAQVQGDAAAQTIVERLKQINEMGNFDTIIVGRGGGSIEDLWPFNEEIVAEAIVASKIPVISSVGHETDTTIADLVADLRVATPTAAAEQATPVLRDVLVQIQDLNTRIFNAQNKILNDYRQEVAKYSENVFLQHPERIYEVYAQKVDNLRSRLRQTITDRTGKEKQRLWNIETQLVNVSPRDQINRSQNRLNTDLQRIALSMNRSINSKKNNFSKQVAALDSLSPLKTLGRGYAIATDDNGNVLKQASDYQVDQQINLRVARGQVRVITKNISEDNNG